MTNQLNIKIPALADDPAWTEVSGRLATLQQRRTDLDREIALLAQQLNHAQRSQEARKQAVSALAAAPDIEITDASLAGVQENYDRLLRERSIVTDAIESVSRERDQARALASRQVQRELAATFRDLVDRQQAALAEAAVAVRRVHDLVERLADAGYMTGSWNVAILPVERTDHLASVGAAAKKAVAA